MLYVQLRSRNPCPFFFITGWILQVHKQGSVLGRVVDLSKLDGYDDLICELERLFDMKGLLNDPEKKWNVVYTDEEDDMMLVGDDPWQLSASTCLCYLNYYTFVVLLPDTEVSIFISLQGVLQNCFENINLHK